MAAPYHRAKFSFDDGPSWRGWTTGETWNGWGVPHFEREQAEQIVEWMHQQGILEDYWSDTSTICTSDEQTPPEGDCWKVMVISTPEGDKRVYPLGARSWTWNVERDNGREATPARHAWGIPRKANLIREKQVRYCVQWWTKVDRPEKRGPSLPRVAPGTAIHNQACFPTAKRAKAHYDYLISGELDFAGEYVMQAWIDRETIGPRSTFRSVYRQGVRRVRGPDGKVVARKDNPQRLRASLI